MIKITPNEFEIIAEYIHNISGIFLEDKKVYLVESRLAMLLKELGCDSYEELYRKAMSDASKSVESRIIDAITTNETLFFRDKWPFELLRDKILPDIIETRSVRCSDSPFAQIRIWCAGCSTGQEVYSVAMVLRESLPDLKKYNVKLLGTDISATAIAQANSGTYNRFEVDRGLTQNRLHRHFAPRGENWQIRDEIRAMATFKRHNLMSSLSGLGMFDIVFCRNVSIYFNLEGQKNLFNKISNVMEQDGCLIIGSTESVINACPRFVPKRHLRAFFYRLE